MFSMFRLDPGGGCGGGGVGELMTSFSTHQLLVVPDQSRARGHGFRAWAGVFGAACRSAVVAVLRWGFRYPRFWHWAAFCGFLHVR